MSVVRIYVTYEYAVKVPIIPAANHTITTESKPSFIANGTECEVHSPIMQPMKIQVHKIQSLPQTL
jgi:hypothetical protein